jgi:hypothetical protein
METGIRSFTPYPVKMHAHEIDDLRDMESEVQAYVSEVSCATAALEKLYPLDTPEKVEQAISLWDKVYVHIAFTTLDTELEKAILSHRSVSELMPEVRRATVNCEAAFEIATARRMVLARDVKEGKLSIR